MVLDIAMINKLNLYKLIKVCKKISRNEMINFSDDISRSFSTPDISHKYNLSYDEIKNIVTVQKYINIIYFYDKYYASIESRCLKGGNALVETAIKSIGPFAPMIEKGVEQIVKNPELAQEAVEHFGPFGGNIVEKVMGNEHAKNAITEFTTTGKVNKNTMLHAAKHATQVVIDEHAEQGGNLQHDGMNKFVKNAKIYNKFMSAQAPQLPPPPPSQQYAPSPPQQQSAPLSPQSPPLPPPQQYAPQSQLYVQPFEQPYAHQ
jgi:hypothetical protein